MRGDQARIRYYILRIIPFILHIIALFKFSVHPPLPKYFVLEQYVNDSQITLNAGGPHTMNEDGTGGGVGVIKGVLIESKLYLLILQIPL